MDANDRVNDSDVKVTATAQIASMYIRKQNIFTEKKIYPYAAIDDLRMDLLPQIRKMAVNHAGGSHPWGNMADEELLRSAGLYGTDVATGETGYNLAAILLLGKDEVIQSVCPAYETDALVRKVNADRAFFRNIGRADRLGSGVYKLFKYTKFYSGKDPVFQEGDVFRIIVPLDEGYSFDMGIGTFDPKPDPKPDLMQNGDSENEKAVLIQVKANPYITRKQLAENTGLSDSTVKRVLAKLRDKKRVERIGSKRSGQWRMIKGED